MSKTDLIGSITILAFTGAVIASAVWHTNAWYNYPCSAFTSGILSLGTAPARCIEATEE